MVILSDKVPVSTRILKKWMAPAWSVQYSSSTEALSPKQLHSELPSTSYVMIYSSFYPISTSFPPWYKLFHTPLHLPLFFCCCFFCNWTALFISPSTSVFLIVLFHSVSVSLLAAAASPSFSSISILPSLISPRVQPLMPAATPRKKHIFCHIAMSVKFRSRVFVYVCVCLGMCMRVSLLQGYFHHQIPFPLQTNTSAGRLTDKGEWESEWVCACLCACLFVCVCVCWLLRAGIRMHWLSFCFYFCLFFPPSIEDRGIEVDIHIGFFSYLKLLWRGFTRLEHNAHPHVQTHAAHERRLR